MFSETSIEGPKIPSSWRESKVYKENASQSDSVDCKEMNTQYPFRQDSNVQKSDEDGHKKLELKPVDVVRLERFLKHASKTTIFEIRKSVKSGALNAIFDDEKEAKSNIIRQYDSQHLSSLLPDLHLDYKISALTFNCNASVLAVAYSYKHHSDWCNHDSYVFLWNVYKEYKNDTPPSTIFEVDNCVSILKEHPIQPSIYAGGTLNGKIVIWNTRNNDMTFAASTGHQYEVKGLHWIISDKKNEMGVLFSCGLDGRIFKWQIKESNKSLTIQEAFIILTENFPRSMNIKGSKSDAEAGIVGMSFNHEDPSIFITGCYGGGIFQCSTSGNVSASSITIGNIIYKNPIQLSFTPHRGHITAIQFSPFSRNIFFSCSVDCEIRIYNLLHSKPVMVIHTDSIILDAHWSPSSPNIAVTSENGSLYIYSINYGKSYNLVLNLMPNEHDKATLLKFNTVDDNQQIVVATRNGCAQIRNLISCGKLLSEMEIRNIMRQLILADA